MNFKNLIKLIKSKSKNLIRTEPQARIVPTMNYQIRKENTIWAGTFQLLWNDLMDEINGIVIFEEGNNKIADDLNKQEFKKSDISEESYYIKSGIIYPELKEEIEKGIKNKFNETSDILSNIDFSPNSLFKLFYAMLKKEFNFIENFEDLDKDYFYPEKSAEPESQNTVEYFGISFCGKEALYKNVSVLFYNDDDDYAVKLYTKSKDEVILYRNKDLKKFNESFQDLNQKTEKYNGNKSFTQEDTLKIPVINFEATASFEEVENKTIKNMNGQSISKTIETIKFKMDKCGVVLKSEAAIGFFTGCAPVVDNHRYFLFDKPFTMFLTEKGKQVPYFAMYVADAAKLQ